MTTTQPAQLIDGLAAVAGGYQGFLVDAWGVLHDGVQPYPGVVQALQALQRLGKTVVILSNAARRVTTTQEELAHVGIDQSLYQSVICSGEMAWQAMQAAAREPFKSLGRCGYYLGTERSRGLLDGLDKLWVEVPEEASFILNTGVPPGYDYHIESVAPLLQSLIDLQLPMLCANPDLVAIRGGVMGISAGAIAQRYAQIGAGKVHLVGKPGPEIYAQALQQFPAIQTPHWLAIGDAFLTDIRGAENAGLDSLLIAGGIHHPQLTPLTASKVAQLATKHRCCPQYYCSHFRW